MHKLYENIKNYRIERGWSQEELAHKANYQDRSMITRIEKGVVDLSHSKILLFSEIFNVDPVVLMGLSENDLPSLSPSEQHLIGTFRKLDDEDQDDVIWYADRRSEAAKYTEKSRKEA